MKAQKAIFSNYFKNSENRSSFAVVDIGTKIHASVKIFHFSVIRSNVQIGHGSVIGHGVLIERDTIIGENTTIQSQCHITAEAIIGDNVYFGPCVVTMNEKKIANQGRREPKIEKLTIGNGARIGAGSILAPGITIGKNAFIKAGSLVLCDVPDGEVWGNKRKMSRASFCYNVPESEYL